MSFLAPLYIAGLLAVSLPVLFHLIRRTPRGQVPFSSLMFLSTSPPRVTRRSRLNNILLLVLRGLALSLLAFAFARPFLRDAASLDISDQPSRRIAILVDRSASMRRGDLWQQAVKRSEQALAGVTPADQVALVAFADRVETIVGFDVWNKTPSAQRVALARGKLQELSPSWGATELGQAIVAAADLLADASDSTQANTDAARQIILITDLQQGARLEALQAYAWPKGVTLDVQILKPKTTSNSGLHLAGDADELDVAADNGRARVRVGNETDSAHEQFTLQWATASGEIASIDPLGVHVPPGTNRVVRVPRPAAATQADRLVLRGDDYDFDNTLYLAPQRQEEVTVAYLGSDGADDAQGLRYYLERALVDTPRRKVRLFAVAHDEALDPKDAASMRLAVVAEPPAADRLETLRKFVAGGGALLVPLQDSNATILKQLGAAAPLEVEEAAGTDFALLGELAYTHPLFVAFADPRFGDFTKIHFWKHRRVRLADGSGWNVLARFDNGDPAVIEHILGAGSVIVLTSSWRPADSQLALSTKFVPLLAALLNRRGQKESDQTQFTVGETLPAAMENSAAQDRPGFYAAGDVRFAVNVAADESRTAPLGIEELEQRGARLRSESRRKADVERRRQLQVAELENRQKLWQWLIVAVLGLVIAETALAGHLTRKASQVMP